MPAPDIRCTGYTRRAAARRRQWGTNLPIKLSAEHHFPLEDATYNQDGLISIHNTDFAEEPRFASAYAKAKTTGSWSGPWGQVDIHWRAHVLCWAAAQAAPLAGDFVECGVNRGGSALLVMEYVGWTDHPDKAFYLYDTFEGLDAEVSSETELRQTKLVYAPCYEEVRDRFARWPNVALVRGSIPGSLAMRAPEKVAYLHIDLNAAIPEAAALEFFWERLVPGAVVVFDDYAWVACNSQKVAIDEVARRLGCEVLSLPTGQGLLIKRGQPEPVPH